MDLLEDKLKLLSKPIWQVKDVMSYFEVGRPYAQQMVDNTIAHANGGVEGMPTRVLTEAILKLYTGHTREYEIKILKSGLDKANEKI